VAHRQITDREGVTWDVWEVHPTLAERRSLRDRRTEGRVTRDRRIYNQQRASVRDDLRWGWLAFQSVVERRRRAPIPPDWEHLGEAELLEVLDRAERTGPPRRLIE
jgi:hypothetical protein